MMRAQNQHSIAAAAYINHAATPRCFPIEDGHERERRIAMFLRICLRLLPSILPLMRPMTMSRRIFHILLFSAVAFAHSRCCSLINAGGARREALIFRRWACAFAAYHTQMAAVY